MPSLIKGANVVWKDSVTLETNIPQRKISSQPKIIHTSNTTEESQRAQAYQNSLKATLEEEYRKKNEGMEARYKLLTEQLEKEKNQVISEAKIYAKQLIQDATNEAEDILNKANLEYEIKLKSALKKGIEEGLNIAQNDYEKNMQQLKNVIDGIGQNEKYILDKSKEQLGYLAVEIFRKIIAMNIDSSDMFLQNMIVDQLKTFKEYKRIKVYLNGTSITKTILADTLIQNQLLQNPDLLTLEYLDDAPEGTCVLETETEMADISISEQLNNLIKNVRNVDVSKYEDDEYEEDEY